SPAQSIPSWAMNISPGPPDEAGQKLIFHVSADKPELFTVQPAIGAGGTLTFTPAPDTHGITKVTVTLQDDGGNLTDDTSLPQTFHITVTKPLIWHNAKVVRSAVPGLDVTDDGHIAPDDAVAIINYINAFGSFQ